jgi:hypothetical protein
VERSTFGAGCCGALHILGVLRVAGTAEKMTSAASAPLCRAKPTLQAWPAPKVPVSDPHKSLCKPSSLVATDCGINDSSG